MRNIDLRADEIAAALFTNGPSRGVCILDSCNVRHVGSRFMVAGINPVEAKELKGPDPDAAIVQFEDLINKGLPVIFTLGYELGLALHGIRSNHRTDEPFIYAAAFDALAVHDYITGESVLRGKNEAVDKLSSLLRHRETALRHGASAENISSNFTPDEYAAAVLAIQERIRAGDTYQTNLTREITAELPESLAPHDIFLRLRKYHPAPFAAYLERPDSTVVSASPERFFRIKDGVITTSPIKGTQPRGATPEEDAMLRQELAGSAKDRAENTMIVDLLRNDLGRVCEFASVNVDRLCELEEHPSLFHLVSTITGKLRDQTTIADIIRALFPCGSITGAPKISTMRIIDELERSARGLSMGAIGIYVPASFGMGEFIDTSVAIRTMTVRGGTAEFKVGGGVVIDSDPRAEYQETVTKSLALLSALGL